MPSYRAQRAFSQVMLRATKLTGVGKLLDATRLIQRTLAGAAPSGSPKPATAANDARAEHSNPSVIVLPASPGYESPPVSQPPRSATFSKHQFTFEGDMYPYRLYVPAVSDVANAAPMPLVVLLHGCKQDALDFSNGTAMNVLADEHQVMVLYPEQITSANAMRCWNWFEPGHQKVGRGEPGMIASLTRKIIQTQHADASRVYIAGLSAGGAMAAVVSGLYPDIFAAVGVHSGLAAGAARDMMSAFGAMRSGAKGHTSPVIPTIVFHGSADKTVHPDNGEFIADAALAALKASGTKLVKTKSTAGPVGQSGDGKLAFGKVEFGKTEHGRAERVVYSTEDGKPMLENWRIDDGVHAWSGGDAAGSYTDPAGPSASKAMLAFFLQQRRPA